MVSDVVAALWEAAKSAVANVAAFVPSLLLAAGIAGALLVAALRLLPERAEEVLRSARRTAPNLGAFLGAVAATAVGALLLVQLRIAVEARQEVVRGASATRGRDPYLSAGYQSAPSVAILRERTYTRRLVLPPDFLSRLGSEGVAALAPYLSDPAAEGVTRLADTFVREGPNAVFTRELTRKDEEPVALDATRIKATFRGNGTGYEARIEGEYVFGNGLAEPADFRFVFPLPQFSGAIRDVSVTVGGAAVAGPDERQGAFVWSGSLGPGQKTTAVVAYTAEGRGGFRYGLGSARRRTRDFTLRAESDREMKFGRAGIFPTSQDARGASWTLKDVVTNGEIALAFPRADARREALDKTLAWFPVVLVLFGLGAYVFGDRQRAPFAACAFAVGLAATPVASGYLPPGAAILIGAGLAAVLGSASLGTRRGFGVAIFCAALAAIFLAVSNAGSLAFGLALMAVVGFLRSSRKAR